MEDCANTSALNKMLNEQEFDEKAKENFLEEIDPIINELSEAIEKIKEIAKDYQGYNFSEDIKEIVSELV